MCCLRPPPFPSVTCCALQLRPMALPLLHQVGGPVFKGVVVNSFAGRGPCFIDKVQRGLLNMMMFFVQETSSNPLVVGPLQKLPLALWGEMLTMRVSSAAVAWRLWAEEVRRQWWSTLVMSTGRQQNRASGPLSASGDGKRERHVVKAVSSNARINA